MLADNFSVMHAFLSLKTHCPIFTGQPSYFGPVNFLSFQDKKYLESPSLLKFYDRQNFHSSLYVMMDYDVAQNYFCRFFLFEIAKDIFQNFVQSTIYDQIFIFIY